MENNSNAEIETLSARWSLLFFCAVILLAGVFFALFRLCDRLDFYADTMTSVLSVSGWGLLAVFLACWGAAAAFKLPKRFQVCCAGVFVVLIFFVIFNLSEPFGYQSDKPRAILTVTCLLMLTALIAAWGVSAAIKVRQPRKLWVLIIAVGISARLISLFTCPILEIDYYRYIWDGKVLAQGVSPYQFSPEQVTSASPYEDVDDNSEFANSENQNYRTVVELSRKSQSNLTIVRRIHFEKYSTIYPPVSQFFFAIAMKWLPDSVSVNGHILCMKSVLLLFEIGVMAMVAWLLRTLNFQIGWLVAYAWNPLVIKEIANGGHLDSIATFFATLSICLLVAWFKKRPEKDSMFSWLPIAGAVSLGLGVGAKLFPIVLFPALVVTVARVRWSTSILFAALFMIAAGASMLPMYLSVHHESLIGQQIDDDGDKELASNDDSFLPAKREGLSSFLSQWRMNDVVFSGLFLNLEVTKDSVQSPWYVVTSNDDRKRIRGWFQKSPATNASADSNNGDTDQPKSVAWTLTRMITMSFLAIVYLWQVIAIYRSKIPWHQPEQAIRQAIPFGRLTLIMVTFLLLQPTVNPWYWVWIAPLAALSRNRGWLIVAGLLLIYYSRFWFDSLPSDISIGGYNGVGLFDDWLAWGEFLGILMVMLVSAIVRPDDDPPGQQ